MNVHRSLAVFCRETAMATDSSAESESGKFEGAKTEVRFEHSPSFPEILAQIQSSLLISTYQAGKLCVVGSRGGKLAFAFHDFKQVMGVATSPKRIAVATRRQIYSLYAHPEVAATVEPRSSHDSCWLARTAFVTGNIHVHELAWGNDGLWIVNTLFSCLCTLHDNCNFVPRWRPPFVTELTGEDRCHLNGLALEAGRPRYVTVVAESDEPAGWRPTKAHSGCILDVPTGETVVRGLSMPHSPRLYDGRLWFLDSGKGRLCTVDPVAGKVDTVVALPGYARGLAFVGPFAFVGLSRIRETAVFGGLPIAERHKDLKCGVAVVDLRTGLAAATLQFHSGVEEIFAVETIAGSLHPILTGPVLDEVDGRQNEIWVVPADAPASKPTPAGSRLPAGTTTAVGAAPTESPPTVSARIRAASKLQEEGRFVEALELLRRAAHEAPHLAEIHNHLGNLHQSLGDQAAALSAYRQAVAAEPEYAPAHQNLGYLLVNWGEPAEAEWHYRLAEKSRPDAMNRVLAATVLPVVYDSIDDVAVWRQRYCDRVRELVDSGLGIDTTNSLVPTHFFLAYQGENDRVPLADLAKIYRGVECCPPASAGRQHRGKKLRVGFLSAYFRDHTIGRLNLERIRHLPRDRFEVTVLAVGRPRDAVAEEFRNAADQYVELPRQPGPARKTIAELGLDLLFFADVGMDALTQTLAYSRMAPVQVATWGHPTTTGSPTMDYFLSSRLLEGADAADHYCEKLLLPDNLAIRFPRPELEGPPRSRDFFRLPAKRRLYLCPQTLFKFHPAFDDVLGGILEADPDGHLVVLQGRVSNWTARLTARWAKRLPDADRRVHWLPAQPRPDFLRLLAIADIVLDPFPFGGGHTSYEALAVATPVVTLPDRFLRGRITAALLNRIGLKTGLVRSVQDYVRTAVDLARDPESGQRVRLEIRARQGELFDNPADDRAFSDTIEMAAMQPAKTAPKS
jgi:protein O-GlcNAc transferase